MNIQIRPMQIQDAPQVASINIRSWRWAYQGILEQSILDELNLEQKTKAWSDGIQNSPHLIRLVAKQNEKILGYVVGGPNRNITESPDTVELYAIYVDPDHMQTGVGFKLFDAFRENLHEQKINSFCVWVLKENKSAREFYQKMNGVLSSQTKVFVVNNKSYPEVCYEFHQ
jgi:ribosomal protein S18 acetylase RimI-like enzyme